MPDYMQSIFNNIFTGVFFLLVFAIASSFAQDGCYNCDYDSLVDQLNKESTDAEKIQLLTLLIDLRPGIGPRSRQFDETIGYIDELLKLNARTKQTNTAPYEILRQGLIYWRDGKPEKALEAL